MTGEETTKNKKEITADESRAVVNMFANIAAKKN